MVGHQAVGEQNLETGVEALRQRPPERVGAAQGTRAAMDPEPARSWSMWSLGAKRLWLEA
jgi:hypothetical protein